MILGIPNEKVLIKSLASDSPLVENEPTQVTLLGYDGELNWQRTADGLQIELPTNLELQHALAFKISGLQALLAPRNALVILRGTARDIF